MREQQGPQHRRRRLRLAVCAPLALFAAGVLTYGTIFGTFGDDARADTTAAPAPVPADAMAGVAAMQPGWNLGGGARAGLPGAAEAVE
ncbi:hypothetical protein [Streptomyces sp. YIM S03343]